MHHCKVVWQVIALTHNIDQGSSHTLFSNPGFSNSSFPCLLRLTPYPGHDSKRRRSSMSSSGPPRPAASPVSTGSTWNQQQQQTEQRLEPTKLRFDAADGADPAVGGSPQSYHGTAASPLPSNAPYSESPSVGSTSAASLRRRWSGISGAIKGMRFPSNMPQPA